MEKNNEVIQTHPLVGWDISTVDSYDALMLRLHYQTPNKSEQEGTEVGQTLWLTTDVDHPPKRHLTGAFTISGLYICIQLITLLKP